MISGVYKITTLLDEKCYVGSSINIKKRWSEHFGSLLKNKHPNKKLQYWVNKHGIRNLVFTVIKICDKTEIIKYEQEYIDKLNSWFNNRKIADNNLGIKHSDESKRKMCLASSISVSQYNLEGDFIKSWESAKVAAKTLNMCSSYITYCCKNNESQAGNYQWRYCNGSEKNVEKYVDKMALSKSKSVYQLDLFGNILKKWKSAREADRHTNINQSSIGKCCKGVVKTAGKFLWCFEEDYTVNYPTKEVSELF